MDVHLTQEQTLLRDSVSEFLERECAVERVRAISAGAQEEAHSLWRAVAELGWPGLTIASEYGGSGLDLVDLAVVFEQAGAALFPSSLFSTVALGAPCVQIGGNAEQQQGILPDVATGKLRMTLAQVEDTNGWGSEHLAWIPERSAKGFRLTGQKRHVPDADSSDLIVLAVRTQAGSVGSEGISLMVIPADLPGITIRPTQLLDGTRGFCEIDFRDVFVGDEALLGPEGQAADILQAVTATARVALCAEMTGGSQRALDLSVAHAKTREQFGKPIGSFQAISHKCADMLVRVESARSATYYAAWALAHAQPGAQMSSCLAKAYCSDAFAKVAGDAIQVHGGLGFTWEQEPHLHYRRAKTIEHFLGDASWNRELAARALLD